MFNEDEMSSKDLRVPGLVNLVKATVKVDKSFAAS